MMRSNWQVRAVILACALALRWASGAALTPGDVLIGLAPSDQTTATLAEFTPGGQLVQTFPITKTVASGFENTISGLTIGPGLRPYVYSGTSAPVLWTIDPAVPGATPTTTALTGWSNVGSVANGSLAAYDHYIFATDESTAYDGQSGGIIRFDVSNGTAQRFFASGPVNPAGGGVSYDKVTVGYNGKIYGLLNRGSYDSPYLVTADAATMTGATQVTLPEPANALAVDAAGDLYILHGYGGPNGGEIDEFDSNYHLLRSLEFGAVPGFLRDIELSPAGGIVVTSSEGTVLLTTTAFASYTTFNAAQIALPHQLQGVDTAAAVFVQPPVSAVPEPVGGCIALAVAAAFALWRRRP